jgi:hypothetical protein
LGPFIKLVRLLCGQYKVAFAATPLRVPLTPIMSKEVPFCWNSKSFHYSAIIFSTFFFLFSYWDGDPPEEYLFFNGDSNVFSVDFIRCCWKVHEIILQTISIDSSSSVSHTAQKWDEFLNVCCAVGTA